MMMFTLWKQHGILLSRRPVFFFFKFRLFRAVYADSTGHKMGARPIGKSLI